MAWNWGFIMSKISKRESETFLLKFSLDNLGFSKFQNALGSFWTQLNGGFASPFAKWLNFPLPLTSEIGLGGSGSEGWCWWWWTGNVALEGWSGIERSIKLMSSEGAELVSAFSRNFWKLFGWLELFFGEGMGSWVWTERPASKRSTEGEASGFGCFSETKVFELKLLWKALKFGTEDWVFEGDFSLIWILSALKGEKSKKGFTWRRLAVPLEAAALFLCFWAFRWLGHRSPLGHILVSRICLE